MVPRRLACPFTCIGTEWFCTNLLPLGDYEICLPYRGVVFHNPLLVFYPKEGIMKALNSAQKNYIFTSFQKEETARNGAALTLAFCQGAISRHDDEKFFYTVRVEDQAGDSYRYSSDGVCSRFCGSLRTAIENIRWNEPWGNTAPCISVKELKQLLNRFPAFVTLYKVTKDGSYPDWDNALEVGKIPLKEIPNWESYLY